MRRSVSSLSLIKSPTSRRKEYWAAKVGSFNSIPNMPPSISASDDPAKETGNSGSIKGSAERVGASSSERQVHTGGELVVAHQTQNAGFFARFRYHVLVAGIALLLSPLSLIWAQKGAIDPTDYVERTRRVLSTTP